MHARTFSFALLIASLSLAATGVFSGLAHGRATPGPFRQDVLSCSPAPCVLPPTYVSSTGNIMYDAALVSNPLNPKTLLLGTDDGTCGSPGFYLSPDGGSTWTRALCLTNIITQQRVYYPIGQPMVAYDHGGEAYDAGEYADSKGTNYGLVGVQKSSDGVNWSKPTPALGGVYKLYLYSWMAADAMPTSPYVNSLYISTVVIGEPWQATNQVFVARSNDNGKSWEVAAVEPTQRFPAFDQFTNMAVGANGTVYVTWLHCAASGPSADCKNGRAHVLFSRSMDVGATWSSPLRITTVANDCSCANSYLPNTNPKVGVYNYPVIAADKSDGPYSGDLYVTMYSWTGTYLQVQVVRSADGGITWSDPVPVAHASANHDQFMPWISVSSTGLVGISWLDRRNDPNNVNYQAFAAISRDGGKTFEPNVELTKAFSNPGINGNDWMGDYLGNVWVGPEFIAAWMDASNGISMQDVVGGVKLR